MKIKGIPNVIFYIVAITLLTQCAKVVTPTGGPKDEEHPLIVKMTPPFNTVNFESKKIEITFNEFIQLKDLNNSLVVSPPLEEKPDIKVKGKTLVIEFEEELKDSTTYNIYFGNAVQDYNEGNPIENFQYVLSTGSYIDSLSIKGQIINSYNLLPEAGVFVMLYQDFEDSVPIKQIPVHVSKTNEEGFFQINNISNNQFKLFCLRDLNKNYLFDMPDEEIAFIDSLVKFELKTETIIDTFYVPDSVYILANKEVPEEREIDSIAKYTEINYPVYEYIFRLFKEYREVQYLANNARNSRPKIEIAFNKPIKDSINFELADTLVEKSWFLIESNANNDSIIYWITDSAIYNKDELVFALSYQKEDSNLVYQWSTDTLNLKYFEQKIKRKEEKDTSLQYVIGVKSRGTMDLNKPIEFNFETPLKTVDTSKIKLTALVDSIEIPIDYDFAKVENKLRNYVMNVSWDEDTSYRLDILPYAFIDIYGAVNDTSLIEFKTQTKDYYGKILANITGVDSSAQVICQIVLSTKDKETVQHAKIIKNDQVVEFDYLPPKEFMFKVIIDKNFNGKWDTGEYLKHIQPEEVLYYEEKIKVRSNWDIEINFDVKK